MDHLVTANPSFVPASGVDTEHRVITARRVRFTDDGPLIRAHSCADRVVIEHCVSPARISDDVIVQGLVALADAHVIAGRDEFERAFVAIAESCGVPADSAWRSFYRNSVVELRSGRASFSPVHLRARSLLRGTSVLEVGSCFGFLAIQCAQDGYRVAATDLDPVAVEFLNTAAGDFGVSIATSCGDARALPHPSDSVDTVTLIHLLEHLDAHDVALAIGEAVRVARRRVVIAVPYEDVPSPHFGHLQVLTEADLREWAAPWTGIHDVTFLTDHGGWIVVDLH
ncbi:MAG: mycofactocin oligosaccharide methyltransferase MftM [Gordonia sp. (in: high G+C Gram-positive bacteria)]